MPAKPPKKPKPKTTGRKHKPAAPPIDTPRRPPGRPTKYRKEHCQAIIDWFSIPKTKLDDNGNLVPEFPTLTGFAVSIGISKAMLHVWCEKHPEFAEAFKKAKELQEDIWVHNSIHGRYNTAFTIFAGKNLFGWSDRQTVRHEGEVTTALTVEFAAPKRVEPLAIDAEVVGEIEE